MATGISCDSPIPNWAGSGSVVNKLSEISSDVCFYACFISILWELSINKYESLYGTLQSMVSSFLGLGRYLLEEGIEIGGAGTGILESLLDSLEELASGGLDIVGTQFESFPNALWAFIKGEVMRYFQPMMLASIQYMVDDLEVELGNRRQMLGEIELKIGAVQTAIENLFGFDWWEDWLAAAIVAAQNVRDADRELQRAYSDLSQGNWDTTHLDNCQDFVLMAWKLLSSDDAFNEFMTEVGDQIGAQLGLSDAQEYRPFDRSFQVNLFNDFMDDLKVLYEELQELKDMYTCVVRISGRATILQALIIAATEVVNGMVSGSDPQSGIYVDVLLEDSAMRQIHDKLVEIYGEMRDVIENERRTVAPIYNMEWRNELQGILLLLVGFGAVPAPLGLDFTAGTQEASNQLNYLVYPHDPDDRVKSLSEYDFSNSDTGRRLQEFVLTAGNLSDLLTRHSQWEQKITQLTTSVRNMKQRDANAIELLGTFDGYDDDRYTYVVDLVESAGWTAAHKYLTSGKLHEFMQLSVGSLSIVSTAMECLSQTVSNMIDDQGLQIRLNELLTQGLAEDRVATRASVALPSFQFQAFTAIQGRLQDIEAEMQDILDLQSEVCS